MPGRNWIVCGALLASVGVVAGALGAHFLKDRLRPEAVEPLPGDQQAGELRPSAELYNQLVRVAGADRLQSYETAVRYQMYHAIALILVGMLASRTSSKLLPIAGAAFLLGIVLFSGGIYGWLLTGIKPLVHVVPFGGISWVIAWVLLALAIFAPAPAAPKG